MSSGLTFSQIQVRGFFALVDGVIAANPGLTADQRELIASLTGMLSRRAGPVSC
jgi:hypothetical protein